jgi:hypothetical protein
MSELLLSTFTHFHQRAGSICGINDKDGSVFVAVVVYVDIRRMNAQLQSFILQEIPFTRHCNIVPALLYLAIVRQMLQPI